MIDPFDNPIFLNDFLDYSATILNKSPNSIKEYNYDIIENKLKTISKDGKELDKNSINSLIDEFNKEQSKSLTYDQLFNTKIQFSEQLSRPLTDVKTSDNPQLSNARMEYINSINSVGLKNLENKLNSIEEQINKIDWEAINVK